MMNFGTFINIKEYVFHLVPERAACVPCKCRANDTRSTQKPYATANALLSDFISY